ncbi:AraC family transcriptional regulator ligand-binding domain-containing protein [uncultured Sneathiella sp.]|uniref:AraC family transcriptional regulator n=1 Tax=uncultured Sneathiella sp. TaxID=879315 RepID=UPI0030EE2B02|tara:strand:+ start:52579 stop:53568 length:990 start_codon:yes stop_codon:yes gene_type:complete
MAQPKFSIVSGWQILLNDLGLSIQDVLAQAELSPELINTQRPSLSLDEYYRFWEAMVFLHGEPDFPLLLGKALTTEALNPSMYASLCSPNLNVALERLARYTPDLTPWSLSVTRNHKKTRVVVQGLPNHPPLPSSLVALEMVFLVQFARIATREEISPKAVYLSVPIPQDWKYEDYWGVKIEKADFNGISFYAEDAQKSFLTANDSVWHAFEPELSKHLSGQNSNSRFGDKVRAHLAKAIASGQHTMEDVARHLAVSTRTLQRRLKDEGTCFQDELNYLREEMARDYLCNSSISTSEIAFALGYEDANSFRRAFQSWTGQTVLSVRGKS